MIPCTLCSNEEIPHNVQGNSRQLHSAYRVSRLQSFVARSYRGVCLVNTIHKVLHAPRSVVLLTARWCTFVATLLVITQEFEAPTGRGLSLLTCTSYATDASRLGF
jgi:hypothetical protein